MAYYRNQGNTAKAYADDGTCLGTIYPPDPAHQRRDYCAYPSPGAQLSGPDPQIIAEVMAAQHQAGEES